MNSIQLVVSPAGYSPERAQLFDAWIGDRKIVSRSATPLFKACRILASEGVNPETVLEMRHRGKVDVSLKCRVKNGALLTVEDRGTRIVPIRDFGKVNLDDAA